MESMIRKNNKLIEKIENQVQLLYIKKDNLWEKIDELVKVKNELIQKNNKLIDKIENQDINLKTIKQLEDDININRKEEESLLFDIKKQKNKLKDLYLLISYLKSAEFGEIIYCDGTFLGQYYIDIESNVKLFRGIFKNENFKICFDSFVKDEDNNCYCKIRYINGDTYFRKLNLSKTSDKLFIKEISDSIVKKIENNGDFLIYKQNNPNKYDKTGINIDPQNCIKIQSKNKKLSLFTYDYFSMFSTKLKEKVVDNEYLVKKQLEYAKSKSDELKDFYKASSRIEDLEKKIINIENLMSYSIISNRQPIKAMIDQNSNEYKDSKLDYSSIDSEDDELLFNKEENCKNEPEFNSELVNIEKKVEESKSRLNSIIENEIKIKSNSSSIDSEDDELLFNKEENCKNEPEFNSELVNIEKKVEESKSRLNSIIENKLKIKKEIFDIADENEIQIKFNGGSFIKKDHKNQKIAKDYAYLIAIKNLDIHNLDEQAKKENLKLSTLEQEMENLRKKNKISCKDKNLRNTTEEENCEAIWF